MESIIIQNKFIPDFQNFCFKRDDLRHLSLPSVLLIDGNIHWIAAG